jgi:hypothetical protein
MSVKELKLSHNGRYIMYENMLYDISSDSVINIESTDILFWLNLLKENSEQSYKSLITKYTEIQKLVRETVYNVSNIFDVKEQDKFLLEFESRYSNKLITENENKEDNISIINSSWEFIIEGVSSFLLSINEQEQGIISKVTNKISSGFNWLKEKGIGWFFEELRKALYSWGGAAVQTFLATFGSAFGGNVVLVIVWGAMLAYDVYLAIQGDVNWVNLLIDLVAVLTTGPGSKILGEFFKKIGVLGQKIPLKQLLLKINNSGGASYISKLVQKIVTGLPKILKWVVDGIKWVGSKFKINALGKSTSQITSRLTSLTDELATATSTMVKPVVSQGKQRASNIIKPIIGKSGKLLQTKAGQVTTSAGITAGTNKLSGVSNKVFGGAFQNTEDEIIKLIGNTPIPVTVDMLP